jgi:hypothetical protein
MSIKTIFAILAFLIFLLPSCSTKLMEAGLNSQLVISDVSKSAIQNNAIGFGSQRVQVATSKLLSVTNSGIFTATKLNFNLKVNRDFIFTGGKAPGVNGTCNLELSPGASCLIEIAYQPTAPSNSTDTLVITYYNNAANLKLSMDLTGYGLTNFALSDRKASIAQQAAFYTSNIEAY